MRRKAVQEHFRKICEDKHSDQKKFWSTIRPFINSRKCKNIGRIVIKVNDRIINDQQEVAENLNDFFLNTAHVETNQHKQTPNLSHIAKKFPDVPVLTIRKKIQWK